MQFFGLKMNARNESDSEMRWRRKSGRGIPLSEKHLRRKESERTSSCPCFLEHPEIIRSTRKMLGYYKCGGRREFEFEEDKWRMEGIGERGVWIEKLKRHEPWEWARAFSSMFLHLLSAQRVTPWSQLKLFFFGRRGMRRSSWEEAFPTSTESHIGQRRGQASNSFPLWEREREK